MEITDKNANQIFSITYNREITRVDLKAQNAMQGQSQFNHTRHDDRGWLKASPHHLFDFVIGVGPGFLFVFSRTTPLDFHPCEVMQLYSIIWFMFESYSGNIFLMRM